MEQQLPAFIVGAPLLFSVIVPILGRKWRQSAFVIAVATVAVSAVASALSLGRVLDEGRFRYYLGGWEPPVGIEYVIVNGIPVIDGGQHTGALPGRAVRKN